MVSQNTDQTSHISYSIAFLRTSSWRRILPWLLTFIKMFTIQLHTLTELSYKIFIAACSCIHVTCWIECNNCTWFRRYVQVSMSNFWAFCLLCSFNFNVIDHAEAKMQWHEVWTIRWTSLGKLKESTNIYHIYIHMLI